MGRMNNDVGAIMTSVQWGDEGSYVREIAARGHLPQLAKVIKGQYLNVGVPSLANPGLSSTLLLLSGGAGLRIAAQSVKFKEGRRVVPVGPKLAIPETYEGYFEILSEDGRSVRCMETVAELYKRYPDSFLVRENLKAFISKSDDIDNIPEKSITIPAGETLVLVGEIATAKNGKNQQKFLRCLDPSGQNIYLPLDGKGKFSAIAKEDNISGVHSIRNLLNKRLPLMVRLIHGKPPIGNKAASQFLPELRLLAAFGEEVLAALPLGKDSPIVLLPPNAPLKLTHAKNADSIEKTKEFMRLCERSTTLLQEVSDRIHVYDISLGVKGGGGGMKDPRFHSASDHNKHRHKHSHHHHHRISTKSPHFDKDKSTSEDSGVKTDKLPDDYDEIDQIYDYVRGFAPLPKNIRSPYASKEPAKMQSNRQSSILNKSHDDSRPTPPPIETIPTRKASLMQEKLSPSVHPALISAVLEKAERRVEKRSRKPDERKSSSHTQKSHQPIHIHQPLQHQKSNQSSNIHHQVKSINNNNIINNNENQKPSNNVVIKNNNNKLFVKASQHKAIKNRMFRHKSASPVKDALMEVVSVGPGIGGLGSTGLTGISPGPVIGMNGAPGSGSSTSPLFKLRYKSLTNLAMDFDTLDSSTSGGKGSGDSSGSAAIKAKIPEKRSRKLTRPKSLTNLVWGSSDPRNTTNGAISPNEGMVGNTTRALLEAERKLRLEPGVYRHARDAPALLAATTRLLASQKKIGTLYL